MSSKTVVVTGGGSGGHITPLLAVATELKRLQPSVRIVYIGQRGDKFADLPAQDPAIDAVHSIRAGKFRRYHGEGLRQLLDIPTGLKNIRDVFYVLAGFFQSRKLLKELQPDVIFIKGGFVGVPVGLAAASRHLPFITHDSDAIPGLANKIIARWAVLHAVALPAEVYQYPADKTVTTGIPLHAEFVPVTAALKQQYRQTARLPAEAPLLFVIGGGLGSQTVNQAVAEALPHLLHEFPNLQIVHSVGQANEKEMRAKYNQNLTPGEQGRVEVKGYLDNVYVYSGAADVIVTRAGATNLAEFAMQGKACIVVPSPFLTGGHQLKNAQYLADHGAAVVINESELAADPNRLAKQASQLLSQPQLQSELGHQLSTFAVPGAAHKLASLLVKYLKD